MISKGELPDCEPHGGRTISFTHSSCECHVQQCQPRCKRSNQTQGGPSISVLAFLIHKILISGPCWDRALPAALVSACHHHLPHGCSLLSKQAPHSSFKQCKGGQITTCRLQSITYFSIQEARLPFLPGAIQLLRNPNSWAIALVWAIPQVLGGFFFQNNCFRRSGTTGVLSWLFPWQRFLLKVEEH